MQFKCQVASHDQRRIVSICFDTKCKAKRLGCQICLNEFHNNHLDQLADIDYLIDFILSQSQKPDVPSPEVQQALIELTNVQTQIDSLSQLIQLEIERLCSDSLSQICKNIGNQYNSIQNDGMETQKLDDLLQNIFKSLEVEKNRIKEKVSLLDKSEYAYSNFMKQFSNKMTTIVKEFQLIDEILTKKENNRSFNYDFTNFIKNEFFHEKLEGVCVLDICENRNLIVAGYRDTTVKLWQNMNLIKMYSYPGPVYDVAFSNSGNLLAFSGDGNNLIKLIDISDLNQDDVVFELYGHQRYIHRLTFSNSSNYLISGSEDHTVRVWDVKLKKEVHNFNAESPVQGIAISSDDILIGSNSWGGKIIIWNNENYKSLCSIQGHQHGAAIQFSHDQKVIATSGFDGKIKLWSLRELNISNILLIRQFKEANNCIWTIVFSPCSRFLVFICSQDGEIKIIDSQTGQVVKQFIQKKEKKDDRVDIAITKKLDMIVYGQDGSLVVWKKK